MRALLLGGSAALALSALGLAGCASGPDDGASAAAKATEAFALDYEAYTLPNGLEVVLQRDTSDPIVAVTTVVHVGSSREKPGRTGFAHFFEHMAFNDSENVPVGANRRDIPAWGGSRNGGTWSDGTIYYETVPKDAFDKILWIDSDRLGYMINTVTTTALEREKQVVKNEKRQRVDNAPYGYTGEVIRTALYPDGHPYSWTVIGQLPDLQAATLPDLREFYDRYYGAGNATLAIVGDIDIEETKEKVAYWFGEIRPGPEVQPPTPQPVTLGETKRLSFEDNFATLPELRMVFPTPQAFHADETALNVLAQILAGSKGAPLYEAVVERGKLAPSVSAYHNAMEIAGEFVIRVRANAGTDLDDVAAAVEGAMADLAENGVDAEDLARIKAEQETALYGELSTALGKSQSFASNGEFAGDPGYAVKQAEKIRAVTADDVMAAFETYVRDRPRIVTSFVPKGQMALAVEGSEPASVWIEEVRADVASEEVSQGEEAQYEKTPTVADRSEPPFGELPLSVTPDFYQTDLPGGVTLTGITSDETPLVSFRIVFEGGALTDADEEAGVTAMLADLFTEGSSMRSAAEIETALGLLGAGMNAYATNDEVVVTGTTLSRTLGETVAIIEEVLTAPRFVEDDVARVRQATLTSIEGAKGNPRAVADRLMQAQLYGDAASGRPVIGTAETVGALTTADLQDRWSRLAAHGVRVLVAGDLGEDAAATAFSGLAEALDAGDTPLPSPTATAGEGGTLTFVDVPGSKQSVILAGRLTVPSGDPAHDLIDFANEKLGGGIGGDLAQTLRIEKGYTYGAYSSVRGGRAVQPWLVQTSVRANATGASLDVIRDMLDAYGAEFGDREAELTKNKIVKDAARAQESLGAKLGLLAEMTKYGLPDTFVEDRQQRLLALVPEDFASTASRWFVPGEMTWVIVGDGETQAADVRAFAESVGASFEERGVEGERVR